MILWNLPLTMNISRESILKAASCESIDSCISALVFLLGGVDAVESNIENRLLQDILWKKGISLGAVGFVYIQFVSSMVISPPASPVFTVPANSTIKI